MQNNVHLQYPISERQGTASYFIELKIVRLIHNSAKFYVSEKKTSESPE